MNADGIKLGVTYKDRITGFVGVATGYCSYITGCSQVLLAPKAKEGSFADPHWFDEQRCEEVKSELRIYLDNSQTPGSDKAAPIR